MQEEHPRRRIDIADGGTGLAIGCKVRKFIIVTESLAGIARAHATGKIELLGDDVVPYPVYRRDVVLVAGQRGHIGYA